MKREVGGTGVEMGSELWEVAGRAGEISGGMGGWELL